MQCIVVFEMKHKGALIHNQTGVRWKQFLHCAVFLSFYDFFVMLKAIGAEIRLIDDKFILAFKILDI